MGEAILRPRVDRVVKRGELYFVHKKPPFEESREIRPKGGRPAIIVSHDSENAMSGTVEVVYLTSASNIRFMRDTQFRIESGKALNSVAKCEQIDTVDKNLLGDFFCSLNEKDLEKLDRCLLISLGISDERLEHVSDVSKITEECNSLKSELRQKDLEVEELKSQLRQIIDKYKGVDVDTIISERDKYKDMYETVIFTLAGKK